jgi:elongation factor Ts
VPEDVVAKEKEVLTAQAMNEGKPANIAEKMVAGRIKKYFKQICLLDQDFVKDTDKTVGQVQTELIAKLGENISIRRFTRYMMGEGLEKKEEDFASEVQSQMK